jgi:hypothetical protein
VARKTKAQIKAEKADEARRAAERARLAQIIASANQTQSSGFDVARWRAGEEASMGAVTPTVAEPAVDYEAIAQAAAQEAELAMKQGQEFEEAATIGTALADAQQAAADAAKVAAAAKAAAEAQAAADAKAAADAIAAAKAAQAAAEAAAKAAQEAADKAIADAKAAADKAAADAKAAAEKAGADAKAAQDAANKAAADAQAKADAAIKAAQEAAANAAAQGAAANATVAAAAANANINVSGNIATTVPGPYGTVIGPATQADIASKYYAEQQAAAEKAAQMQRQSVMDNLSERFTRYNLQSLIPTIKRLAQEGATESTITLTLQESDAYKQRFRANEERIKKGLQVLDPATYLRVEDGYRQTLRAYGLTQFDNDDYVSQFIANDVSPGELSNRVVTAVQRVRNADPAISRTLRDYYGIGQNDLVAYVLDPNQQFPKIERQVAAAEIGAAARLQGLEAGVAVSEQLAAQGITQAQAQRGYATIADILPTAEKLSDIYGEEMAGYGQAEAEQEVFNQLASAQRKRQRLTQREIAQFSGQSGLGRTSLDRETRGQF